MENLKRSFLFFLLVSLFFPVVLIAQSFGGFQKSVLVDIPGNNYDFDLLLSDLFFPADLYITWVNNSDSVYTIYLKKLTPETIDSSIVITSDNTVKSNPEIAYNSSGPGISILWENFTGSYYQVVRRDFSNGLLSDQVIIKDSLNGDPQIALSYNNLALIMGGNLYIKDPEPGTNGLVLIDTTSCSSPALLVTDNSSRSPLLYEKSINGNQHIYLAELEIYPDSHWVYYEFPEDSSRNPSFGAGWGLAFEIMQNGISRINYAADYHPYANFLISKNTSCSYKNPEVFSYPIPTEQEDTPFFVAFDTDSLENNNEVMIKKMGAWPVDSLINISDMTGDDLKPKVGVMNYDGTPYVFIIWEHRDNVHSTIWMAKTIFHPAGEVKEDGIDLTSFELFQNYPNPFNPSTSIEYSLKHGTDVKVKVFDVLGNHILTLIDGYEYSGRHKVIFDGKNLSSGVYFYTIEVKSLQKTKAMILLK